MHVKLLLLIGLLFNQTVVGAADGLPAQAAAMPDRLAAHYAVTHSPIGASAQSGDLYLVRQPDQVEIARGIYTDVWQRDQRAELSLIRVFHQDRKLIEYEPGELRTRHAMAHWPAVNGLFDPRLLGRLAKGATQPYLGRTATAYTGKLGKDDVELLWLEQEALIARYVRSNRDGSLEVALKTLQAAPGSAWPPPSLSVAGDYGVIDAADLGDMEYDPFVQRVLGMEGHGDAHAHHVH